MKTFFVNYGGLLMSALYGVIFRLLFGSEFRNLVGFSDLASVTFVWVLPVLMGIIPMLWATKKQLDSYYFLATQPVFTVSIFFLICSITELEDIICLIILGAPFLLIAAISGILFGRFIRKIAYKSDKFFLLIFLPILSGFVEGQSPSPNHQYHVESRIEIGASKSKIWKNVVRVERLKPNEYPKGFFNYLGIPQPLFAEVDKDTIGGKRIGYFENGLKFREIITEYEKDKKISFSICILSNTINQSIFEKHILMGQNFKFINASYQLDSIAPNKTILRLSSSYELKTFNYHYGSFWGNYLLSDFQNRLLSVLKKRSE